MTHIDGYRELKGWLATKHTRNDTWRGHCINYWINELGGLAGVW